ncbi:hypothetical protein SVIO_022610 [Streptomyces violaceusniger]|uniref:Uncharacterized protein n=1 Tax=Streptomyces violaceusniger TaxID=68280 RepID=A0A4D4KZ73_STRVO|nr:hypothetical protein SVIO_022610 [Streptomyces violaceusniger]
MLPAVGDDHIGEHHGRLLAATDVAHLLGPEQGPQPVMPVLPNWLAESSASRAHIRPAGSGRTRTWSETDFCRPSSA